jgi:hypothetical protein
MGCVEIEASLTYLAVKERVAASTRNQASVLCCFSTEKAYVSIRLIPLMRFGLNRSDTCQRCARKQR